MKVSYFPGCTLKTAAKNFEDSALASAGALGIELVELPKWYCCGTVYSLASDDLIHQLAPIRTLLRVKEAGDDTVVTLCAMCYNTLKRANLLVREDEEKREKINDFMYEEETKYSGEVEVYHLLQVLRDEVGFEKVKENVKRSLRGLKVAPYYGCLLVRPLEVGLDDPEGPTILDDLLTGLGADVVDYPYKTECCGSYNTVDRVELVADRTREIVGSAKRRGAEILATSCPLCQFNLDDRQRDVVHRHSDFSGIPVLYFTQLMAVALGLDQRSWRFDLNFVDPMPVLQKKIESLETRKMSGN